MEYEREESMGYIIPEQALLQVGQTLLKAGVQTVMSGVMSGFETWDAVADPKHIGGGLMSWAGDNGVLKGILSAGNQGVTNVLNGLIQGTEITLDDDGNFEGFRFNGRTFEKMTVGEGALGGYLSSFVGTASTQMFQDLLPKVDLGDFGIDLKMDTSKINALGSTLGGLMGELASVAADGEFTMNLLNLSDLMIWFGGMGTKEAQNYSMGLFEFGIGVNDEGNLVSRSRFGTGGAKLNLASNWGVWDQIGSVLNVNKDIKKAQNVRKSIRDGGENTFNGDSEVSADLIEILFYEEEAAKPTPSARPRISNIPSLGDPTLPTFPVETPEQKAQREEQERKQQEFKEDVAKIEALSEEEQLAAIKELIEKGIKGIDTSYSLENAEGFMKKYVTEEDLVAFDLDSVMQRALSESANLEEAIQRLVSEVADVNNLSASIDALVHHLNVVEKDTQTHLSKSEVLRRLILKTDGYINQYNDKIKELQSRGVVSTHWLFNPFDQDFQSNMAALQQSNEKVILEQNLIHSRTLIMQENGTEYIYQIDSQMPGPNSEIDDPTDISIARMNSKVYRFKSFGGAPEGSFWSGGDWNQGYYQFSTDVLEILQDPSKYQEYIVESNIAGQTKVSLPSSITGRDNPLEVDIMDGSHVLIEASKNDLNQDITVVDAYLSGFVPRKISYLESAVYKAQTGRDTYVDYEEGSIIGGLYEMGRAIDGLWKYQTDSAYKKAVDDLEGYKASAKYKVFEALNNNGYAVMRSQTYCDSVTGQRSLSYTADSASQYVQDLIAGSSRYDKFENDPYMASISFDYAVLLARTSAFVLGQLSSHEGESGHVNQLLDMTYDTNGTPRYYFANGGEWNGVRLNAMLAWYRSTTEQLKNEVSWYVYTGPRRTLR
jgi:hypothetical protein